MPEDPQSPGIVWSTPPAATSAPTDTSPNPSGIVWNQSNSTPTTPEPSSNGIVWGGGGASGQPEEPITNSGRNPSDPWYKQLWDTANTPLTESLFGMKDSREGAGGFERGVEKIASGFTTPLSLALTIGTFGTAGFLESAGASALREAGLSATQIAEVAKGSEAAAQAYKESRGVMDAVRAAGVDPAVWKQGVDTLYGSGLKEADLTGGGLIQRGLSSAIRKGSSLFPDLGLTASQAQTAAKTAQTLTDAGFTYQNLQQAAQMSPRVLDSLRDGDYDHAAEYATEALAGGALGAMGAAHAFSSAGELAGLGKASLRPSDESLELTNILKEREGLHEEANDHARVLAENAMKALGYKDQTSTNLKERFAPQEEIDRQNQRLAVMDTWIRHGGDPQKLAETYNSLAEAAGREDRLPVNGQDAESTLPPNIADLIAKSKLKDKPEDYTTNLLQNVKDAYEGLSDKETEVAKTLRNELDKGYEVAHNNGLITSFVQDYMRRVWKQPDNPAANGVIQDAALGKFAQNVSMARHRVFGSDLEGLLAGQEYAVQDPIKLTAQWLADTNKAVANRKVISDLLDKGTRAPDGMPAAVLSGNGQVVEGADGKNPATLVNPKAVRNIAIASNEIEAMSENGQLERHLQNGTIADITPRVHYDTIDDFINRLQSKMVGAQPKFDEQGNSVLLKQIQTLKDVKSGKLPVSALDEINAAQKPVYVWRPQGYVTLNNPAMRGWNFMANDPSGNGVLAKTDIMFHPEYSDYIKTRLGLDESGLQKFGPTKAVLKAGSEAKKVLLSFSVFHTLQESLRAVMMGVNPLSDARIAIEDSPELQKMARGGTTLATDYRALQDHSEGLAEHSKILSKLPFGIGKSLDWYQDYLFKRYIPSLKSRAAVEMYNRYKTANPTWSDDRVAEVASKHVNDTFGGQNWKALGVNATTQDWARLLTLAPDWLASEINSTARLFNRAEGGISRAQMAKLTLGLWGTARVLNLLNTGNAHYEAPFSLATKNKEGKDILYSVRTLPTDILHLASDPVGFMKGRLSPLVRTADELYSSRDKFGRKLTPGDMAIDVFRNLAPIPVQAVGKISSGLTPDTGNTGQVVGALGGTATTYRTEAEKLTSQLASDRTENGPLNTDQIARHHVVLGMEDKLRTGQITPQQVQDMYINGSLTKSEADKIKTNFKQTRGLPPDKAALYVRASRLAAPDLLKVWDLAVPSEKVVLEPLLTKAKNTYIKRAVDNLTPEQRATDPTLKRLRTMFAANPF